MGRIIVQRGILRPIHDAKTAAAIQVIPKLIKLYIYIFNAIVLNESIFLDVLHFPMKNIKSRDLEAMSMGGATSKPTSDVVCLLLLARRQSRIAMALGAKI